MRQMIIFYFCIAINYIRCGRENITEFNPAEKALQESETRYRMLFTHMTDGFGLVEVVYTDDGKPSDYRYLEINPAFGRYLGVDREQMLGRTMLEVFPNVSPAALKKYHEVAVTGQPVHFEIFSKVADKYLDIYVFSPEKGKLALMLRDISERKQTEKALHQAYEEIRMKSDELQVQTEKLRETNEAFREREARLQVIVANSPDIIFEQDRDLHYVWIYNPSPPFSVSDVMGKTDADLLPPDQAQQLEAIKHRVLETGISEKAVVKLSPGGEPRWFEAIYEPRYDVTGQITGILSYTRDVTERKQVEEELKKALETLHYSEDQFRGLFNNVKSGVALIDETGRFAVVNPSFMQIFGLDRELDILNVNSQDWSRWEVYGENGKLLHIDARPVRKVFMTGKPVRDQLVAVRNPGANELTWMLISAEPVMKEDDRIYRVICTYYDITGRKRAEAKLEETLDNLEKLVKERTAELEKAYNSLKESEKGLAEAQKMAHVGNWEWEILTEKSYWSDELYRIFGRSLKESHPTYEEFLNYVHPSDREYVDNTARRAMKGKTYSIDYRIIRADGKERTVHMESEVIFDDKNTPVRIKGIVQDITERKQAEEALTKMEKIRIKEIHHRIKNNLQVISSLLDLQAETFSKLEVCKTPEVVEAFMESQSRIISMALIHEELYRGDKIDSLDFAVYLRKLAADLFNSYNPGNKNISLKLDLGKVYLGMDTAIPLGIIVNELVSNSFKHAFPSRREGKIQINLQKADDSAAMSKIPASEKECMKRNGFQYILTVSDNGKGIPEGMNIENSNSLGLQLVNILVEQIDSCMELDRDQGTKFTIWFNDIEL